MNRHMWQRMLYSVAGLVVIAGVTYACKDFLDQPAQGTVDQATLMNKVGVEGSLIAAYRALDCEASSAGSWGCAASNWVWGSVTSNDAYKGSDLGDQNPIHSIEVMQWNLGDADGYLNQKWAQVYEGVYRANATLRLLNAVVAALPNEIGVSDQNSIRGEALFLRAHYHFEAYRMWGHIPYYFEADSQPVALGGYRKPNDMALDAILNQIIADLDSASKLLPPTPRNGEKGRVTKWTALAYKGRVQVYLADLSPSVAAWTAAKTTFDAVKAANVYALEAGFNRVWTADPAYRNGKETILAFQASAKDGEPSGWNSNWGERLNFPYSDANHFTCCGFHQPTFNLVNFFQVDAAGLPLSMSSAAWNSPPVEPPASIPISDTGQVWKGQNFHAGIMRAVDPRLDWSVGRDGVPYKDWNIHGRGWIRDASYSGPYSPKKNIHEQAFPDAEDNVGWVATQTNNVPIHIFRYADMLLLDAEAEVELGNLDAARAIVNQIRARAGVVAQGCGADTTVHNAFPTYCATRFSMVDTMQAGVAGLDSLQSGWAFYKVGLYNTPWAGLGAAYARNAVRTERRLELAMEGQRFFDLRRWGIADTSVNNYAATEAARIPYLAGAANAFILPKYEFYPIPSVQVELSKVGGQCMLQQNPQWGACQ
jgi:starch-binding outer membrane protein, SusD/RagB family